MDVSGYVRGVPTYEDLNGNTYGMLCETKEKCITDDSGVALDFKLEELRKQIESSGRNASTLEGHNAAHFATAESVTNITDGTTQVGNSKTLDGHGAEDFAPKTDLANYLPLTGGTVESDTYNILGIKNKSANGDAFTRYENGSNVLGYLGINAVGTPTFKNGEQTANYELLHTGNSAKVVISETAPSDTTALWVW